MDKPTGQPNLSQPASGSVDSGVNAMGGQPRQARNVVLLDHFFDRALRVLSEVLSEQLSRELAALLAKALIDELGRALGLSEAVASTPIEQPKRRGPGRPRKMQATPLEAPTAPLEAPLQPPRVEQVPTDPTAIAGQDDREAIWT